MNALRLQFSNAAPQNVHHIVSKKQKKYWHQIASIIYYISYV